LHYENLIKELLRAYDASEMQNYHVALERLRLALREV
jgi:hypothetical protein